MVVVYKLTEIMSVKSWPSTVDHALTHSQFDMLYAPLTKKLTLIFFRMCA